MASFALKLTTAWRGALCVCSVLLGAASPVMAEEQAVFDIAPQPLSAALKSFASQANMQLLYRQDAVEGATANAVIGTFEKRAALEQLLRGTGLEVVYSAENAVTIRAKGTAVSVKQPSAAQQAMQESTLRLAQVEQSASSQEENKTQAEEASAKKGIPEILVKGRKTPSLNADIERTRDDVRPYVILDRDTISRSGASTVDELLRNTLTMSYVPLQNSRLNGNSNLSGNSSNVALRGLSSGETLILVDGRRATKTMLSISSDESQTDINGIPLSAIERIEVLPASASGIYGGAATGGVINVILRRDYTGLEATLNYQNSFEGGGQGRRIDFFAGTASTASGVSLQVRGSYADNDSLKRGDRGYLRDYRQRRQNEQLERDSFNYLNAFNPPLGSTTNISSFEDGAVGLVPLTLKTGQALGSPITSLPTHYTGSAADTASLIANAGRYNVELANSSQLSGSQADLVGGSTVGSLGLTLRKQWTPRVKGFIELSGSKNDFRYAGDPLSARFMIPASAPNNPFDQDIFVNAPLTSLVGAGGVARTRADSGRALGSISWAIGESWSSAVEYSYSTAKASQPSASSGLFLNTVRPAVRSGAIDLLQDADGYASVLAEMIVPQTNIAPTTSSFQDIAVRAAGKVVSLPAGEVSLSVLAEGGQQGYGALAQTVYQVDGSSFELRTTGGQSETRSLYAEVTVPIASERRPLWGMRSAEFQFAGRYDRYEQRAGFLLQPDDTRQPFTGKFDSAVPTVGIRIEPIGSVILRASYGKGFLPPYLNQLQATSPTQEDFSFLTDPKRAGEALGVVTFTSGGNPTLEPETSISRSAGIIYTPVYVNDLRLAFDWTQIKKRNNIAGFSLAQRTVDNEDLFSGVIIRGSPDSQGVGRITAVDISLKNLLRSESESYDISADWSFDLGGASWRISGSATRLLHNIQQRSTSTPSVDFAGTSAYPNWSANASLILSKGTWSASLATRYLDSYWINDDRSFDADQNSARLGSQTFIDLMGEYDLGGLLHGISNSLSQTKLRVGIKNVFDAQPRYLAGQASTVSDFWGDPFGRVYWLSASASFGK